MGLIETAAQNGEMIDLMHIKVAQKLVERAKRLENKL
jgi:hypothetical protein